jgi:hypothetical protein
MAGPRLVEFNALPRSVRERFIGCTARKGSPEPILSDTPSYAGAIVGWTLLAMTGAAIFLGVASAGYGKEVQDSAAVLGYAAGIATAAFGVFSLVRRIVLQQALPFKPGRYMFPMDLVDAREPTLRIVPMHALIDFRGVHQHTNGVYNGTTLTFTFEEGIRESFTVHGKMLAEQILNDLRTSQATLRKAVEDRDVETLYALDPFIEVRLEDAWLAKASKVVDGPAARTLPALFRGPIRLAIGVALGLGLGFPAYWIRNRACDEAMFESAKRADTVSDWKDYLSSGGKRHEGEVKDSLLPRSALKEAKEKGSVTALREFLKEYPGSCVDADAHALIHDLFKKTLADFKDQSSSDPKLYPFMERLVGYLEAHESSAVEARFHSPSSAKLAIVDTLLQGKLGGALTGGGTGRIAAVAPHFDAAHSIPREAEIVKGLAAGFAAVFPADIMAISEGKRVEFEATPPPPPAPKKPVRGAKKPADDDAPAAPALPRIPVSEISLPTLEVQYQVGWSGDMYTEEKGGRRFVGVFVTFDVSMRIPGDKDSFDFALEVTPPDHFSVEYFSNDSVLGLPSAGDGPSEGKVYDVMAERAFDQLTAKMRGVFFRPGSKAYGDPNAAGAEPSADPVDPLLKKLLDGKGDDDDDDKPAVPGKRGTNL